MQAINWDAPEVAARGHLYVHVTTDVGLKYIVDAYAVMHEVTKSDPHGVLSAIYGGFEVDHDEVLKAINSLSDQWVEVH